MKILSVGTGIGALRGGVVRRHLVLGGLGAAIGLPLAGCGGGAELFVPFFVFTFDGTLNGQVVSLFLNPDAASSCTENGRFESASGSLNGVRFDLAGTFSGRSLSLSFTNPPAGLATAYSGRFIDDATVALTPMGAGAAFSVTRTGNRTANCPAGG
jgi:hypothetical protein